MEKDMNLDLAQIFNETLDESELVCESSSNGQIKQIFNDEKLTFGEMRDIFNHVFSGQTNLMEKVDGLNVAITYKDGEFRYAKNKKQLKDPISIDTLSKCYEGEPVIKDAYVNTANSLGKALQAIDTQRFTKIFDNGRNFLNVDIVYPPARNIIDYGNRCILQLNSLDVYDDNYNKIDEDTSSTKAIYNMLKSHNALKQEMFEISKPNVLKIKDSVDADEACREISDDIAKLVDGIGYKATIQDYCNDRLKKYIVNCAMKKDIDVGMNSEFINEMANRISYVSHRRPTMNDLACYAKRDGINPRSQNYKDLLQFLHTTSDDINVQIMKPIEDLILKASKLLFKNLVGFMAADPNKNSQRIATELEETVKMLESDDCGLTNEKLRRFHKDYQKIMEYEDESTFPTEGVIFKYTNKNGQTKTYKMTGNFGSISQLINILRK